MEILKIVGYILLGIFIFFILISTILSFFGEIEVLKDRKNEAIKYIDKCLSTDNKLDLDAVLITIKSILDPDLIKKEEKELKCLEKEVK